MGWDTIREVVTAVLLLMGSAAIFLAAVGLYRMPDLFLRMAATSKSTTLGAAAILLAVAVHFGNLEVTSRVVAAIVFVLLTAPVAAHMIARAAYFAGAPLWERSAHNDLIGNYDPHTHSLASGKEYSDG